MRARARSRSTTQACVCARGTHTHTHTHALARERALTLPTITREKTRLRRVPDNATSVTDVSSAGAHGSIFGEGSAFEGVPGVGKGGCCSSRCKLCGAADGDVNLPSSPGLLASTY